MKLAGMRQKTSWSSYFAPIPDWLKIQALRRAQLFTEFFCLKCNVTSMVFTVMAYNYGTVAA
jgi:hypothetical protein